MLDDGGIPVAEIAGTLFVEERAMATALLSWLELQAYGVRREDIQGGAKIPTETWSLPDDAKTRLRSLLESYGCDVDSQILIEERPEQRGFGLRQP